MQIRDNGGMILTGENQ